MLHEIDVPFQRPRREDIIEHPDFIRLRRELSGWLREEQLKMQGDT